MARVLLVVPAHEALRASAHQRSDQSDKFSDEVFTFSVTADAIDLGSDERVVVDPTFTPVPIGTAQFGTDVASLAPENSDNFVVRAEVPDEMAAEGYVNGHPVFGDPDVATFAICPHDRAHGTVADVRTLHNIAPVHARGMDGSGVAIAVMDTGISAAHLAAKGLLNKVDRSVVWNHLDAVAANGRLIPPGGHNVDHGTMSAYDALIAAPNAQLLDYPILHRTGPGGSVMSGTLGGALQAYAHLEAFWSVVFGPTRQRYNSLVVTNSWGLYHPSWDFPEGHPGRYIDNPMHPFNIRLNAMARQGIDIIFAAGNCGADCPSEWCQGNVRNTIMGGNAHPAVLTLAGISTSGGRIGYSSEGPPLPGMGAPEKPDLACATHFLGSQAMGPSAPDSGTSAACPVAAGCVAALRTAVPQNSAGPQRVFDALRRTARQPAGGGSWNAQLGYGVLDLDAAARSLGV